MTPATIDISEQLVPYAVEGRLPKRSLASLLTPEPRQRFLDACALIEKSYTDACAAAKDPCLESGCSCEGEICLQPLLRASTEYQSRCGVEWAALFAERGNRDSSWKVTAAGFRPSLA